MYQFSIFNNVTLGNVQEAAQIKKNMLIVFVQQPILATTVYYY